MSCVRAPNFAASHRSARDAFASGEEPEPVAEGPLGQGPGGEAQRGHRAETVRDSEREKGGERQFPQRPHPQGKGGKGGEETA